MGLGLRMKQYGLLVFGFSEPITVGWMVRGLMSGLETGAQDLRNPYLKPPLSGISRVGSSEDYRSVAQASGIAPIRCRIWGFMRSRLSAWGEAGLTKTRTFCVRLAVTRRSLWIQVGAHAKDFVSGFRVEGYESEGDLNKSSVVRYSPSYRNHTEASSSPPSRASSSSQ